MSNANESRTFAREATFFISGDRFFGHAIGKATDMSHTPHLIQYIHTGGRAKLSAAFGISCELLRSLDQLDSRLRLRFLAG
jgi:hypothetical protein